MFSATTRRHRITGWRANCWPENAAHRFHSRVWTVSLRPRSIWSAQSQSCMTRLRQSSWFRSNVSAALRKPISASETNNDELKKKSWGWGLNYQMKGWDKRLQSRSKVQFVMQVCGAAVLWMSHQPNKVTFVSVTKVPGTFSYLGLKRSCSSCLHSLILAWDLGRSCKSGGWCRWEKVPVKLRNAVKYVHRRGELNKVKVAKGEGGRRSQVGSC